MLPWQEPMGVPHPLIASPNYEADNKVMLLHPKVTPYLGMMKVDSGPRISLPFLVDSLR